MSIATQTAELEDDGGAESQAAWQLEYTPADDCLWLEPGALKQAVAACNSLFDNSTMTGSATLVGEAKFSRRSRRKGDPRPTPLDEPAPFTRSTTSAKRDTISQLSNPARPFLCSMLPDAINLNVNRLSSTTSTSSLAPSSVAPFTGPLGGQQPSIACPYPRPYSYAVFAGTALFAGSFISEYTGEVRDLDAYRRDPVAQYDVLGCCKPAVRAVPPPFNLVVDARRYGNETRFIRSSCHPNAVIRPIVIANGKAASSPVILTFGVFALTDIAKREEIVLPWDWADGHIVHLLPQLLGQDSPSPQPRLSFYTDTLRLSARMATLVVTLLGVTTCACEKRKDCAVAWLFKLAAATRGPPKAGRTRVEAFEDALLTGTVTAAKAGAGPGKKVKAPHLGPLVGLQRGWWPRSERLTELNRLMEEEGEEEEEAEEEEDGAGETTVEVDADDSATAMDIDGETMEVDADEDDDKPEAPPSPGGSATDPMSSDDEIVLRRVKRRESDRLPQTPKVEPERSVKAETEPVAALVDVAPMEGASHSS
jgi:hypothetical protein